MRRLRLLAPLAGSALTVLAGALALPSPASAASAHPMVMVIPHAGQRTITDLALSADNVAGDDHVAFDREGTVRAGYAVTKDNGLGDPVPGGQVTASALLRRGGHSLASNWPDRRLLTSTLPDAAVLHSSDEHLMAQALDGVEKRSHGTTRNTREGNSIERRQ
jgi:hypothetical protein